MTQDYPLQLAERLRARKAPGRSLNKASFLAVEADVIAALGAGFVPKDIWRDLRNCERINFSYDTFLRLAKPHISSSPVARMPPAVPPKKAAVPEKISASPALRSMPATPIAGIPTFVYTPNFKKEDLI